MIDTHAHLLYYENKDELVGRMNNDGLNVIVNIGTTVEDSKQGIDLAGKYENIYTTVGIYPEYAESVTDEELMQIEKLAKKEKVVAIGEIGLDYHSEGFNKKKQIEIFKKQLEIANKLSLPFCIHCRAAAADVYDVLKNNKHLINNGGLMHCYSEGAEWIDKFLSLGLYISFSGNITFKNSDRSFLKKIPLDKLLVETDAPYLTPVPFRGQENEPKNVRYVIEKIAEELNLSFEELEKITEKNAKTFYFDIKKV